MQGKHSLPSFPPLPSEQTALHLWRLCGKEEEVEKEEKEWEPPGSTDTLVSAWFIQAWREGGLGWMTRCCCFNSQRRRSCICCYFICSHPPLDAAVKHKHRLREASACFFFSSYFHCKHICPRQARESRLHYTRSQ